MSPEYPQNWMKTEDIVGLDPLIAPYVDALRIEGIETFDSCQSTAGHFDGDPRSFPYISLYGGAGAGYKAVGACLTLGLPVVRLSREWSVVDCALETVVPEPDIRQWAPA